MKKKLEKKVNTTFLTDIVHQRAAFYSSQQRRKGCSSCDGSRCVADNVSGRTCFTTAASATGEKRFGNTNSFYGMSCPGGGGKYLLRNAEHTNLFLPLYKSYTPPTALCKDEPRCYSSFACVERLCRFFRSSVVAIFDDDDEVR